MKVVPPHHCRPPRKCDCLGHKLAAACGPPQRPPFALGFRPSPPPFGFSSAKQTLPPPQRWMVRGCGVALAPVARSYPLRSLVGCVPPWAIECVWLDEGRRATAGGATHTAASLVLVYVATPPPTPPPPTPPRCARGGTLGLARQRQHELAPMQFLCVVPWGREGTAGPGPAPGVGLVRRPLSCGWCGLSF